MAYLVEVKSCGYLFRIFRMFFVDIIQPTEIATTTIRTLTNHLHMYFHTFLTLHYYYIRLHGYFDFFVKVKSCTAGNTCLPEYPRSCDPLHSQGQARLENYGVSALVCTVRQCETRTVQANQLNNGQF